MCRTANCSIRHSNHSREYVIERRHNTHATDWTDKDCAPIRISATTEQNCLCVVRRRSHRPPLNMLVAMIDNERNPHHFRSATNQQTHMNKHTHTLVPHCSQELYSTADDCVSYVFMHYTCTLYMHIVRTQHEYNTAYIRFSYIHDKLTNIR